MKINAELALDLRKARSWSQEELAIAAGLNLRTIQRIESEGIASLQSKKALASAFNLEAVDLDYKEKPKNMKYEYKVQKFEMKWKSLETRLMTDFEAIEHELCVLGAEGWELVKQTAISGAHGYTNAIVVTMKRLLA